MTGPLGASTCKKTAIILRPLLEEEGRVTASHTQVSSQTMVSSTQRPRE
jgi:hypothetical protein